MTKTRKFRITFETEYYNEYGSLNEEIIQVIDELNLQSTCNNLLKAEEIREFTKVDKPEIIFIEKAGE